MTNELDPVCDIRGQVSVPGSRYDPYLGPGHGRRHHTLPTYTRHLTSDNWRTQRLRIPELTLIQLILPYNSLEIPLIILLRRLTTASADSSLHYGVRRNEKGGSTLICNLVPAYL